MKMPLKQPLALICLLAFCWSCSVSAAAADVPADPGHDSHIEASGLPEDDTQQPEPPEDDAQQPELPEDDAQQPELPEDDAQPPELPETDEQEPEVASYTVTLGQQVIGQGETLSFTTISPAFAGMDEEGYYPGNLTVELTGQVVVEAGGSLEIGTLSVGGPEASPVITGTGSIVVKAGGHLRLTCAVLSPQGEGPTIIQETGGSVEFTDVTAADGLIQWAGPLVNNAYDSPDDLWLQVGTVLTSDLLPASTYVDLQEQGREDRVEVSLSWNLGGYDGRTDGALTLTGVFLDGEGQPLPSLRPLEIAVSWFTPGALVVTDAEWKGSTVPTVHLTVPELPEFADVWGETSTDGGETWVRWTAEDSFFLVEVEGGGWACVFKLPDDSPRLFRIAAEDPWSDPYAYWQSESVPLGPSEDSEDSGGNRGGSTTPSSPDREPEFVPRPDNSTAIEPVPGNAIPDPAQPEEPIPETEQPLQTEDGSTEEQQPAPETVPSEPSAVQPEHPARLEGNDLSQAQPTPLPNPLDQGTDDSEDEAAGPATEPLPLSPTAEEPEPEGTGAEVIQTSASPAVSSQVMLAVGGLILCAGAAAGAVWMLRRKP